ncbi:MAG: type II toxin-antitoxin system VapC family toxin [Proteobacteria bacterium]|nr:type II toxin-antitoxin system VapC family toxin [Pseudomonadota bacterium]MBI3497314.1 type II toxin-antitoxin system VapC family toxin [Pseudomonadota bacterium]
MIVADTSALMAVILGEPTASACMTVLEAETEVLLSAGTMAEALIVAGSRGVGSEMDRLIDGLGISVVPTTASAARRVADAYARWGRGNHRAALNFGDCFAYALAMERACPLLFVGADFAKTDVEPCVPKRIVRRRGRSPARRR